MTAPARGVPVSQVSPVSLVYLLALLVRGSVAQTCSPKCSICLLDITVCRGLSHVIAVNPATKALLLIDGTISELRASDFSGAAASLTLAAFSRNAVSRIEDAAFGNLSLLRSLMLDGNSLADGSLTPLTFAGLGSLRVLRLDGNSLRSAPGDWFRDLTSLELLHLGGNSIGSVGGAGDSGWPPALSNLTGLNLTRNRVSYVARGAFAGLPSLRWLDLSDNGLSAMPDAFAALAELRGVRLGGNPWDCGDCALLPLAGFLRGFTRTGNGTAAGEASGARCAKPASRRGWLVENVTVDNCGDAEQEEEAAAGRRPVRVVGLCGEYVFLIVLLCILALFAAAIIVATVCHRKLRPRWPLLGPQVKPAAASHPRWATGTSRGQKTQQGEEEEDIHVSDCTSVGSAASRRDGPAARDSRGGATLANGRWRGGQAASMATATAQADFSSTGNHEAIYTLFTAALAARPTNPTKAENHRQSPTSGGQGRFTSSVTMLGSGGVDGRLIGVSPGLGNDPGDAPLAQLTPRGNRRIGESFSSDRIEIVAKGPLPAWERQRRDPAGPVMTVATLGASETVSRADAFMCHTLVSRHVTFVTPDASLPVGSPGSAGLTGLSSPSRPGLNGRLSVRRADGGHDAGSGKGGVSGMAVGDTTNKGNGVRFIMRPVADSAAPGPTVEAPRTEGEHRSRTIGESRRDDEGNGASRPGRAAPRPGDTVTRRRPRSSPTQIAPASGTDRGPEEIPAAPASGPLGDAHRAASPDARAAGDDARRVEAGGAAKPTAAQPSCDECTSKYAMTARVHSSSSASSAASTGVTEGDSDPHDRPTSIEVITFAPQSSTAGAGGRQGDCGRVGPQPAAARPTAVPESSRGTAVPDRGDASRAKPGVAPSHGEAAGGSREPGNGDARRLGDPLYGSRHKRGPVGGNAGKKLRLILPEQRSEASSEDRLSRRIK